MSRTKIVATLGPASCTYSVLRKMVVAGLDVGRLNFSHGSYKEHLHKLQIIRTINKKYRRHVRILQDLEGFRIRICCFKKGPVKQLKKHSVVWLTAEPDNGDDNIIPFDYKGDLTAVKPGQLIYVDDGNIILKAKASTKKKIKATVEEGDFLKERKGVNMPGVRILFAGITDKDKQDLQFGIKHKVDFVAQSFVRTAKDMKTVRKLLGPRAGKCRTIAKIESKEAIRNIDDIIDASDGIMVARGDMGVAVPIYKIPLIQKMIIHKCNHKKKFVITATQMLEHMTEHSRPTRAEVTDVANAIIDGTDYVMLSEESAAGQYPVESVKMMEQIIRFTEEYSQKQFKGKI